MAADLLVSFAVLVHPIEGDYRYQLAQLPDPGVLAEALVAQPGWDKRTRHVRKLAECGEPGLA